jgi:hypothetical protein
MKRQLYISTLIILIGCSSPKIDNCEGQILDLEMGSFNNANNKLLNYYKTNTFVEIFDTTQLLRYEEPGRISHFFQPSSIDKTKRKYTYKVKEAIIKTTNYQWDLLVLVDNDQKMENVFYWLKSYDNNRKQVGHLDFAGWSGDQKYYSSGRIDCDSTLHMILKNGKEHRIFTIDHSGKNNLKETIKQ